MHLALILSLLSALISHRVDYVSAYTQAPVESRLSTCGNSTNIVLQIKKNMHGLKQGGNNWFGILKEPLLARGLTQSSIDPCLFLRSNCIIIF